MAAVFRDTWLTVVKRLKADWLILATAFITILLATTLLAAGPIYAESVFLAGAQRTLENAPPDESNIAVSARLRGEDYAAADAKVRADVQTIFQPVSAAVRQSAISGPFTLPTDETGSSVAVFQFFEGIEEHAALVGGSWAQSSPEPFQVTIPAATASALGLSVGDQVQVENRLDSEYQPTIVVSGIYTVNDPNDPYWLGTPLETDGIEAGATVTTFGPFVTTQEIFATQISQRPSVVSWRVLPAFDQLNVGEMSALRDRLPALTGRLNSNRQISDEFEVETQLPAILDEIDRSLLATRSGIYILILQLAILAAYALILTAGLLVDQRRVETALLRSRGADVRQLFALAVMEGIVLTLPAVALGPILAALSLRLLNRAGPLADVGIAIEPIVGSMAYVFAALAGLGCIILLSIPALRSAGSVMDEKAVRGRQTVRTALQRAGVDLGLIVVAAIGFLQLRRYGAPITDSVQGRLEIDPLLIAAPALGMLAGAVLALRIIPQVAMLADRAAGRGAGLLTALGAWQIGRRSVGLARSALLLILALGIGLFAVSYATTWRVSQADQADFQIGADIRIQPQRYSEDNVPAGWLPAAYAALDGVQDSMPVNHEATGLPTSSGRGQVVLVDSARAAGIVHFRDDLADEPFEDLMQRLTDRRPRVATIPLPGEPQRLDLELRFDFDRLCHAPNGNPLPLDFVAPEGSITGYDCRLAKGSVPWEMLPFDQPLTPAIVVRDAAGSMQRIEGRPLEALGNVERATFSLTAGVLDGQVIRPVYPLELVAIELTTLAAPGESRTGAGELLSVAASNDSEGDSWNPVELSPDPAAWEARAQSLTRGTSSSPTLSALASDHSSGIAFSISSGTANVDRFLSNTRMTYRHNSVAFRLRPSGSETLETLPVIISERLFIELAFQTNDTLTITVLGERYRAEVIGLLRAFPSLPEDTESIIVADWETIVAQHLQAPGQPLLAPSERWLSVDSDAIASITNAFSQAPLSTNRTIVHQQRYQSLMTDPVALGMLGALSLGFVAAAIFAGIGFVASATVSARQRLTEFALLRALGLSPRQLAGWLLIENGFLIASSLVLGVGLGFLLALEILPLVAVNQSAAGVFPEAIVTIPWLTIVQLVAAVLGVVLVFSALVALLLRQVGLGELLRIGED